VNRSKLILSALILILSATIGLTTANAEIGSAPARQVSSVPGRLTYQGHLLDAAGEPVLDGSYVMTFSLWDAAGGGSQLWGPESHSVDVSDGFFSVLLGENVALDASTFGADTYIEIAVGGETLAPRQPLASVAFAFLSGEADHAASADVAPWSGLTGVPAGFADGVDDDTTYSAGSGLALTGTQFSVTGAPWAGLTGVPAGFADGVDNDTTYSAGNGLALAGTEFSVTGAPWSGLTGVPAGFADGVDNVDDAVAWSEISGVVGTGASQVAVGNHTHDARYYTESELQTGGSANVHWGNLTGVPAGFADGVDNISGGYANLIVVAKGGGDYTSIQAALDSITDASAANPYLVRIAPGVYTETVTLKSYVSLEGAGEGATRITYTGGASESSATLTGASHAELRFLTVQNTGGNTYAVGIYNNSASPRLTHVTVSVAGGTSANFGVYNHNASPTIQDTSISAVGGSYVAGVYNYQSSPALRNAILSAAGGTTTNDGVYNTRWTGSYDVWITHSQITGSGRTVYNGAGYTTRVGMSQLDGGTVVNNGALTCAGVYDESYTFYASTCP